MGGYLYAVVLSQHLRHQSRPQGDTSESPCQNMKLTIWVSKSVCLCIMTAHIFTPLRLSPYSKVVALLLELRSEGLV